MGERLDAAARISARTVRAASRTPLGMQVKESLLFYRRVARAAVTEAISRPPEAQAIESPQAAPHPGLRPQPADEFVSGDDERCSCRRPDWCGATKGDIVHDLMSRGMRLDREQAETIWRDAQDRRGAWPA
ncbi:hypothetical protein [Frondihabitans peucedani]|uniref:Uncharacterized protein n=1 Tax=Frondihabitans peucedani TaxID=598626 RepID=A0ABP8E5P7_9MICO